MIHIYSAPVEGLRLKSFGATVKGTKSVLTIAIEIDDPQRLGFMLADLAALDHAQKHPPKPKPTPKPRVLPAPERLALPSPTSRGDGK